ncbi:MAG: DNA replication/repair protein RecF [Bacteroidales bacterium]|nr:DNA replication/repair protein RecF [Bacteroidales bacterium]
MPYLKKIFIQDFRNIEFQDLEFSPNINCISGNNGEGKTNLMDAIWYLSMTKSALSSADRFNVRYGAPGFTVSGAYQMQNGLESRFALKFSPGGEKKMVRDDKPYAKISEHIGLIPIVMVSPSDTSLVSESGEERRKFVNSVLSQMDREYLAACQQYNRLLQQRNSVLRAPESDKSLLSVFDLRMEAPARKIFETRAQFAGKLSPAVAQHYANLSGGAEKVSITYRSDLQKGGLADLLADHLEKDKILGYTGVGVQRDDFIFTMNDHPIRRGGSQGQQKSFLVSLKFAQYDIMKESCGFAPILLLDDVFDKLDMTRISNLLSMVAGTGSDFGQIFITDSNKVRMQGIVDGITDDRAYFETVGGKFTRL